MLLLPACKELLCPSPRPCASLLASQSQVQQLQAEVPPLMLTV